MGAGEGMVHVRQYSHQVKEAAFGLYCQNLSAVKTARRIPEMYGDEVHPHLSTIERWIREGNWTARRKEIRRETEALTDQHRVRTTAELLADMSGLREKVLDASNSLEFKSAEGTVLARRQADILARIEALLSDNSATGK